MMENKEEQAIREEIIENLIKTTTELEKRITQISYRKIPDHTSSLNQITGMLEELKAANNTRELFDKLDQINAKLGSHPKPVHKQVRLLLFPETNQALYYKIVFGRLIPWGFGFLLATYSFIIGYRAIQLESYRDTVAESKHYQRAWLYLQQHSKKKVLSAMDEAYEKTADK